MGYCDISEVKAILQITESTWDYELDAILPTADALIDGLLKREGLTVPGTVPQLIKSASAHFAAWLFRRRRDPAGAEVFWSEASKLVEAYAGGEASQSYVERA
jgi:hypothetical protein